MTPILTVTLNPAIDIGLEIESLDPIGKCRAVVRDVVAGGGGINVARAVVELGGTAVALHTAGAETGSRLGRLLREEGMEHQAIEIRGETREAIVLYESDTERSFHVVPPGPELSPDDVDAVIDAVGDRATRHDTVVMSGSLPPGLPAGFFDRLCAALAPTGARLVLDPSGAELPHDRGTHVLKLNRREAARLLGTEIHDFDDAIGVNEQILDQGWASIAATTVGEHGAVVSTASAHHELHTPDLPGPARSDAGAGDSFMAGLTLGLAQHLDVADAGTLAVAAASACVLTSGTERGSREDIERLRPLVGVVNHRRPTGGSGPDRFASGHDRRARDVS